MASQLVQSMPQIELDAEIGLNLAPRWRIRLEYFQMYLAAMGKTDTKKKRALLLYQAGPKVRRRFFDKYRQNGGDNDSYKAVEFLNVHFQTQKHRLYAGLSISTSQARKCWTLDQYYSWFAHDVILCHWAPSWLTLQITSAVC